MMFFRKFFKQTPKNSPSKEKKKKEKVSVNAPNQINFFSLQNESIEYPVGPVYVDKYSSLYSDCRMGEINSFIELSKKTNNPSLQKLFKKHENCIKQQEIVLKEVMNINKIIPKMDLIEIKKTLYYLDGNFNKSLDCLLNGVKIFKDVPKKVERERKKLKDIEKNVIKNYTKISSFEKISFDPLEKEKNLIESNIQEAIKEKNRVFYLKGEKEQILKNEFKLFSLNIKNNEFHLTPEEIHYRIVESQTKRTNCNINVNRVEYVCNPKLLRDFEQCKIDLAKKHGWLKHSMKPVILFHGTSDTAIDNIIKTNFLQSKISANTGNTGYYGKGFYFSENPQTAMGYCRGGRKMLVCLGLVGKAYKQQTIQIGRAKEEGYDSHVSGCGNEVVIFTSKQILPRYIIHF